MKRVCFNIAVIMLLSSAVCSCSHEKEARAAVDKFITAWKSADEVDMKEAYPDVEKLPSYYKADEATITDIKSGENDTYEAVVHMKFTNGFGKSSERDITFFAKPKDLENKDTYIVFDSKGLTSFSESDASKYYKFAKAVGAIKPEYKTDVQIAQGMADAMPLFMSYMYNVKLYLQANVNFSAFNWQKGYYSDYASGNAVCMNNTPYDIPSLKYKVTFYRGDNVVTQEDGYIGYGTLNAGESTSFSFYASYVGNATTARVEAVFDDSFIEEIVANSRYEGKEYEEYLNKPATVDNDTIEEVKTL